MSTPASGRNDVAKGRPGHFGVAVDERSGTTLIIERATKRFGPTVALDQVSIDFHAGEIHALVGENGAGKSTLISIIAGAIRADPPTEMTLGGQPVDVARFSPRAARHAGISVVPQEPAVIEAMTVAENIFLGQERAVGPLIDRRAMRHRAAELLHRLGAGFAVDAPVESLTMAQLQLVEVARALSYESRVVAFDEPSAALAGDELRRLFETIHQLADDGIAVIFVSHRLNEVFAHCDRFTVLKDGRVSGSGHVTDTTRRELVRMMVGRTVDETFFASAVAAGAVRLRVSDLTVAPTVQGISFEARSGEILGIAGLTGSGRTTMAKAIFGAIPATGTVEADGTVGPFRSPQQALRAGLAYVPEDRRREGLAVRKPVRWNASLLALRSLIGGPLRLISGSAESRLIRQMIAMFRIRTSPTGDDPLFGGNQQKVVLAKWLEAGPRVLLLDEPTRGIDIGSKQEIYQLLRQLADRGLAVIVISSELIEVIGVSDRILVISEGRIAGEVPGRTSTEEQVMDLATSGAVD
jgi:rhamnose transport system ATP-binding protein